VCGVWCVVCGVWCVVCGVWCVVCGVWCVVCVMCVCLFNVGKLKTKQQLVELHVDWSTAFFMDFRVIK